MIVWEVVVFIVVVAVPVLYSEQRANKRACDEMD